MIDDRVVELLLAGYAEIRHREQHALPLRFEVRRVGVGVECHDLGILELPVVVDLELRILAQLDRDPPRTGAQPAHQVIGCIGILGGRGEHPAPTPGRRRHPPDFRQRDPTARRGVEHLVGTRNDEGAGRLHPVGDLAAARIGRDLLHCRPGHSHGEASALPVFLEIAPVQRLRIRRGVLLGRRHDEVFHRPDAGLVVDQRLHRLPIEIHVARTHLLVGSVLQISGVAPEEVPGRGHRRVDVVMAEDRLAVDFAIVEELRDIVVLRPGIREPGVVDLQFVTVLLRELIAVLDPPVLSIEALVIVAVEIDVVDVRLFRPRVDAPDDLVAQHREHRIVLDTALVVAGGEWGLLDVVV